jgi:hypothetical protein
MGTDHVRDGARAGFPGLAPHLIGKPSSGGEQGADRHSATAADEVRDEVTDCRAGA